MRTMCSVVTLGTLAAAAASGGTIQIGFLWHMHQPIYVPYQSPLDVDGGGYFSFSVTDVHNQRFGPYTTWPLNAVQAGAGLAHLGAQVSFSGSLAENLDALDASGVNGGMWSNWKQGYRTGAGLSTTLGNPRLDMVAFGYHHPLMPLLDREDMEMQIRLHQHVHGSAWQTSYSKGMFPAETAFSTRMIPALAAPGIDLEWVLVDNIHMDRACVGYPHTNASNLYAPNAADQINPDPAQNGGAWVQLNNLWAPSKVSAPFGYRPHHVQHVDPETGAVSRIVAVPAARYEGNEDGRGGYGAFLYDAVMDAYLQYNTDPQHPMFVVLHHDGDNFGGGSEAYYHHNFQNMVSWVSGDPDYEVTTVQDYLDRFPVDPNDVIHVEPGSWAGADNGDPEFKKWLGDPDASGWSPDRNSWAVLTAAKNRVFTADAIAPWTSMGNILNGVGSNTERAWHYLLCAEASDYWYWDGTEVWDSNVTRGCNLATNHADAVIGTGADTVAPTVFLPQRDPYNPGGYEWGTSPEPSDFTVWTFAYDVSGLTSVTLKWRVDADGANPIDSVQNETYAGGPEVGAWNTEVMAPQTAPVIPSGIESPTHRATEYAAMIAGQSDVLIDYYVEAIDGQGNVRRTDIQHVYVGQVSGGGPGGEAVEVTPDPIAAGAPATVQYDPNGGPLAGAATVYMHYGFDGWATVISPDPAMTWNGADEVWEITVPISAGASQFNFVFNDGLGAWDNNGGADWNFPVQGGDSEPTWSMDGVLDADAVEVASNQGIHLYAGVKDGVLYVATEDAGEGNDHFIYLASPPGSLVAANWGKSGLIAQWSAFLADENDNDYESWFDAGGANQAATGPNGGVIEGTIDLAGEFGAVPASIHLAVGVYATADGAPLQFQYQTPASVNGDGNLDAPEYVEVNIGDITVGPGAPCTPGDADGDGIVTFDDLNAVLGAWLAAPGAYVGGDVTGDGVVNFDDLNAVLGDWGSDCG
ncbi:MAG: carbohydrate-binding protein [Phycisphaerales bacterium]